MMEGIDRSLRVTSWFDWISVLWSTLQLLIHFPTVRYSVPVGFIGPGNLRRLLAGYGVRCYGLHLGPSRITWGTKAGQCWTAQAVLDANGIPFDGGRTFKRQPFVPGAQASTTAPTTPTAATSPAAQARVQFIHEQTRGR
jgi:hypothetical protein